MDDHDTDRLRAMSARGTRGADPPLLRLTGFGVAAGQRVLLNDVDLEVPARGVVSVMGPGSSGKSTLLRAICGVLAADPAMRIRGDAFYRGRILGSREYPVLVRQKADILLGDTFSCLTGPLDPSMSRRDKQLRVELQLRHFRLPELLDELDTPVVHLDPALRRLCLLIRAVVDQPRMICVDEPTADLRGSNAHVVLDCLHRIAQTHAVLFVTHNQQHARRISSSIALLNDREIVTQLPTEAFFTSEHPLVQNFVRTGGIPEGAGELFSWSEVSEAEIRPYVSETRGPVGFRWLEAGRIAGTPMPGVVTTIEEDLHKLDVVGVDTVISLNHGAPVDEIQSAGFDCLHLPFDDMTAPTFELAAEICGTLSTMVDDGHVIALHCRAGLGRTGTILASYLIHRGTSASLALRHIRTIETGWVQSEEQEEFLTKFEHWLDQSRPDEVATTPPNAS